MNKYSQIFTPAEILLPQFSNDGEAMSKWAVIACDQHTSEPEYWKSCTDYIAGSPSAYDYILPEAYLGTLLEAVHTDEISENMKSFDSEKMKKIDGMIYVERTLPDGAVRHGIIGKLDLEKYDYSAGSKSPIRATEETVLERIPPRCKVRASAAVELPHILILIDNDSIFSYLDKIKSELDVCYDFELMQGGGHITGYSVVGDKLQALMSVISAYEASQGNMVYAMGDGNHSLAAAKAHWENVKKTGGNESHPARYALCEITALSDESLVFHPIYRIIKNCDTDDILNELKKYAELSVITDEALNCCSMSAEGRQSVAILTKNGKYKGTFSTPCHALTVGTLQSFIDAYIKAHPTAECDYIHGEDAVYELSTNENCIGFLVDGMQKTELFPYVEANGTLPRKTFSMGEADSKRFYLEMRKITE